MALDDWLPTGIVIAVSNDWLAWLAGAVITVAIVLGAWKLFVVLRRMP
jgi:hypothetical protein